MPITKSIKDVSEKWGRVTPQRTEDYAKGVASPLRDWGTNTKAAEANYGAGVQAAIAEKRFGKGVDKAGTLKWKKGAVEKGTVRFGPGVQAAQPDYEKGMGPVLDTIGKVTLPPRFPSGDPRNMARVASIATALHNLKIGK